jgi:outer membrane receptor for ferric coprogen and ferric-rhodotorulic acid
MRIFRICIFMRIFNIQMTSDRPRDWGNFYNSLRKGLIMSFINHTRDGQRQPAATPSLLAACIAMALMPTISFAATSEDTVIVDGSSTNDQPDEAQDYSVKTTTSGTKLLLVPRDIPQSVSVISQQRMQDQELNTIGQVLDNTTGVSASRIDTSRTNFYSRGFFISNFAYEDMPTFLDNRWNFGDTAGDTAIYDKIEVVRGAAGLMSGTGNPSAYVNMVRKHADSKEFKGSASATYGSWDKQRYVLDLQAPLTDSGNANGLSVMLNRLRNWQREEPAADQGSQPVRIIIRPH